MKWTKSGVSFRGDPGQALLEVLDPARTPRSGTPTGACVRPLRGAGHPTANFVAENYRPVLDALEVVESRDYTELEQIGIARGSNSFRAQLEEKGLTEGAADMDR